VSSLHYTALLLWLPRAALDFSDGLLLRRTTIWETWQYDNAQYSHNHPAYASISAWLSRWVAGVRLDDGTLDNPSAAYGRGFERVLFAPGCVTDPRLTSAAVRVPSLFGPIEASWENHGNATLVMNISLPANTRGELRLPRIVPPGLATVTEAGGVAVWRGGRFVSGTVGVSSGAVVGGAVRLEVGSGTFSFVAAVGG